MSREIRSPVYQIDFTAVDAGKRIASTKRRIRWRFGFTNQDALAAGETGTACRGEEHDITLIWSLTSGKRLVLADGQEVHYSNNRSQVFDFSWTMRGNHVLKVVAHGTTPMNAHPNFRQYDFFVDGMSFFSMPKVYRLGLTDTAPIQEPGTLALAHSSRRSAYSSYSVGGGPSSVGGRSKSNIVEIETPSNALEEEAYLREAIKASLSEQENAVDTQGSKDMGYGVSSQPKQDDLLIDFMSEPGPAPAPPPSNPVPNGFAMVSSHAHTGYGGFPPPVPTAPTSVPVVQPQPNMYVQPPPTFATAVPATTINPVQAPIQPTHNVFAQPLPTVPEPLPVPASAIEPTTSALTMAPQSTGLGSDANAAYAKFASMDQFDLVKPKAEGNRANPFDDPIDLIGAVNAPTTLADMKAMKAPGEKKEVMKNNSMVVTPNQSGNWGGVYSHGGVAPSGYYRGQLVTPGIQAAPYQEYGTLNQQVPQQYGMYHQGQAPHQHQQQQHYGAQTQQPFG